MKPWRAFLLVVLIVLLPLRGALAATMPCAAGHHVAGVAGGSHASGHMAQHASGHDAHHGHHPHREAADEAAPGAAVTQGAGCHVCASFCSATPLLLALPAILEPVEARRVSYPSWAAPAPLFLSDGQERPPRST